MCTKHIHGRVSIDTLDWPSINTQKILDWPSLFTWSTLDWHLGLQSKIFDQIIWVGQHFAGYRPTVDRVSTECQSRCQLSDNRVSTKYQSGCQFSVDREVNWVSIAGQFRVLINTRLQLPFNTHDCTFAHSSPDKFNSVCTINYFNGLVQFQTNFRLQYQYYVQMVASYFTGSDNTIVNLDRLGMYMRTWRGNYSFKMQFVIWIDLTQHASILRYQNKCSGKSKLAGYLIHSRQQPRLSLSVSSLDVHLSVLHRINEMSLGITSIWRDLQCCISRPENLLKIEFHWFNHKTCQISKHFSSKSSQVGQISAKIPGACTCP